MLFRGDGKLWNKIHGGISLRFLEPPNYVSLYANTDREEKVSKNTQK